MSLSLSKKEEGSSCTTIGCINNVSVERRGEGGERGEGEEGEREEREEREGRKINQLYCSLPLSNTSTPDWNKRERTITLVCHSQHTHSQALK